MIEAPRRNAESEVKGFVDRVGVTSAALPGSYECIISTARQEGFRVFELPLGDFDRSDPLWPRGCEPSSRDRLKQWLSVFDVTIARATAEGVNIASINHGVRDESVEQYMECIACAHHIGASIVSFHPGTPTWGFVSDPQDIIGWNTDFGRKAAARAHHYGLALAFMSVGIPLEDLEQVIDGIDDRRLGVDLDLGYLGTLGGTPRSRTEVTDRLVEWIERFSDGIVLIHASGVHQRWHTERLDRCPLEMNNCIDYATVLRTLKRVNYKGPIILEIKVPGLASAIGYCVTARGELAGYWDNSGGNDGVR